jgi:hypothetical protein
VIAVPEPKGATEEQKAKLHRCEKHLEGKPGINRFAVCRASIMGKGKKPGNPHPKPENKSTRRRAAVSRLRRRMT